MPFRVRRQQRLREVPQRIRAVLLHVIHTQSTNDLALQQPQLTHGLRLDDSFPPDQRVHPILDTGPVGRLDVGEGHRSGCMTLRSSNRVTKSNARPEAPHATAGPLKDASLSLPSGEVPRSSASAAPSTVDSTSPTLVAGLQADPSVHAPREVEWCGVPPRGARLGDHAGQITSSGSHAVSSTSQSTSASARLPR